MTTPARATPVIPGTSLFFPPLFMTFAPNQTTEATPDPSVVALHRSEPHSALLFIYLLRTVSKLYCVAARAHRRAQFRGVRPRLFFLALISSPISLFCAVFSFLFLDRYLSLSTGWMRTTTMSGAEPSQTRKPDPSTVNGMVEGPVIITDDQLVYETRAFRKSKDKTKGFVPIITARPAFLG